MISINDEFIITELESVTDLLKEIKTNQAKILEILQLKNTAGSYTTNDKQNKVLENNYNIIFPINTIDGVEKLEKDCVDVNNAYKVYQFALKFKPHQENKRICSSYGLSQLFTDKVLTKYNWDGKVEKLAFNKLKRLNSILFRAWRSDLIKTFPQYTANIRHQLLAARTRVNKRNNVQKKRNLQT